MANKAGGLNVVSGRRNGGRCLIGYVLTPRGHIRVPRDGDAPPRTVRIARDVSNAWFLTSSLYFLLVRRLQHTTFSQQRLRSRLLASPIHPTHALRWPLPIFKILYINFTSCSALNISVL